MRISFASHLDASLAQRDPKDEINLEKYAIFFKIDNLVSP
jgi:hypothetical protein